MRIAIIGAGIGGLTAGIALRKKGFNVTIFEQAPIFKSVGAGIILANNAMQVYQKLGLLETLYSKGQQISEMKITDHHFKHLSSVKLSSFEKRYGVYNIAIHRADLHEILVNELGSESIRLNHRLTDIMEDSSQVSLVFNHHTTEHFDLVIGADGLHSVTRKYVHPTAKIRTANQICWRGVVSHKLEGRLQHQLNESWGKGKRFGIVPLTNDRVYWYALLNKADEKVNLSSSFNAFPKIVSELIEKTPSNQQHFAEIEDLEPNSMWYKKRIVLIGDAAHATTPNLGQGACQAIEDAYCLGEALEKEINSGFKTFLNARVKKANNIVKTSWTLGKVAHWENSFSVGIRNFLLKSTPDSIATKRSSKIFKLCQL